MDAEDRPEDPQSVPPLILPVVVEETEVLISENGVPPLTLPVVEDISYDTPASEMVPMTTTPPESSLPPPPGFAPFVFLKNDGGMDVEDLCTMFSGDSSRCAGSGCLVTPLKDSSSVELPAVGYARLPLPSVDNSLMPELVWVPALPQPTGRIVEGEVPVSRWRLAREGPFLAERSPESIRSLGPGCAFRNTTYRVSDYAEPVGDYGLPLNHPRFVEWIRVPQSAGLIELSGRQWVSKLSRDQAIMAAVHLQRDVGLMQTNVDVFDQYALSL